MKAQAKTARGHSMSAGGEGGEGCHAQAKTGSAKTSKIANGGDKMMEEMTYAGKMCCGKVMRGMG